MTTTDQLARVEPHAARLEDIADGMDAAGIGGHPTRGHAVMLRYMASCLRAGTDEVVHIDDNGAAPWSGTPSPRLSAMSAAALVKAGIEVPDKEGEKIPAGKLDAAIAKSKISIRERIALKSELARAGLID